MINKNIYIFGLLRIVGECACESGLTGKEFPYFLAGLFFTDSGSSGYEEFP